MAKKIAMINVVCNGSTGNLMTALMKACKDDSEVDIYYGRGNPSCDKAVRLQSYLATCAHGLMVVATGRNGAGSVKATKKLIDFLDRTRPDIIHMHNIHGFYLNIPLLFQYLINSNAKIIWTLHDCWSFTGHCMHFSDLNCYKWQDKCYACPAHHNIYPRTLFNRAAKDFPVKRDLFLKLASTGRLTLVTPSQWLADCVRQSFWKDIPLRVIRNGVDLSVFYPRDQKEIKDVLAKYSIPEDTSVILGVSATWDSRKRLNMYNEVAEILYRQAEVNARVVLVGLDPKSKAAIHPSIIGISRTEDRNELACLYSAGAVTFYPSVEDTAPCVLAESLACGTPIVCTDKTGCPEMVTSGTGSVCPADSPEDFWAAICKIISSEANERDKFKFNCRKAAEDMYDAVKCNNDYVLLFGDVLSNNT